MPQSVRVDLEWCLRGGRAWTADPLWASAYRAALKALALTVAPRAHPETARKRRLARSGGARRAG